MGGLKGGGKQAESASGNRDSWRNERGLVPTTPRRQADVVCCRVHVGVGAVRQSHRFPPSRVRE